MFDIITEKFDTVFRSLRGLGKITEANIQGTVRDIRIILLEADVNYIIVKTFIEKVKYRAEGTKVIKSIKPGEQFIKIIHDELITLLKTNYNSTDINYYTKYQIAEESNKKGEKTKKYTFKYILRIFHICLYVCMYILCIFHIFLHVLYIII